MPSPTRVGKDSEASQKIKQPLVDKAARLKKQVTLPVPKLEAIRET